mmetsp:Transcript_23347/g.41151  ORF Transcript_23347/g.41151 Transcript_23347/m.41151 type:complete len:455 (+) Transcript_23347:126-1490(+)|eukprot:CAMPEP_0171497534 /NCGR_PEP_ID=MMETSP0958-20121227/7330_1 /TAXON_ID=87120 /ORGANISM="Aurantiochytrium limacinum, Strain ATCCMYA-1381" /LENGTH=454 /DNA_ID=CAMNT_0012031797 /DNA_START=82 /DNA_END=1446 /DNA_ORIENTATION=-
MSLESTGDLETDIENISDVLSGFDAYASLSNNGWLLITGMLVFFMHTGFAMLEGGSVRHRNGVNIMYKNIGTMSFGAFCFWLLGYGFAYGGNNADDHSSRFIGSGSFALAHDGIDSYAGFFFQAMFAATAATIVSGAVAGRVALPAYFGIAIWLTIFVYPVIVHWIWATGGWISAFQNDGVSPIFSAKGGCGMLDFAGSGVVHMTGGVAAFWAALFIGPRLGRWTGDAAEFQPHNLALCTFGTFALWFGWYGFNCGSTLVFDGDLAGHVAVTTTLAPAAATLTGLIVGRFTKGDFDLPNVLNCCLAGLVSITAGCPSLTPGFSIIAGMIGALVYMGSSKVMKIIGVDDPVDAISVHGAAGLWGLLAVGCFADPDLVAAAYSEECYGASGIQIATQLVGGLSIFAWVSALVIPLVLVLKFTGKLRVSEDFELAGLDSSEHGGLHISYIPGDDKLL